MTKTSVSVSCFRSLPLWKNIFSQFSDSIILSALANIYFYLKSGKTIILGTFISLKEMKFKVNIGQGDLDVKLRKIRQFLEDGDKVKISLWFKGREIVHRDKGKELFDKFM